MKIEDRIRKHRLEIEKLEEKLELERANMEFECCWCGGKHKIKDCNVIQTYYWSNAAYDEGWRDSDLHIVCPTTKKENRIYFQSKYSLGKEFSWIYKRLFKKVIDRNESASYTFSDRPLLNRDFKNNTYFDEHKVEFLPKEVLKK